MEPFLRWAGGKRWLTKIISPLIQKILNSTNGTYYEPFLGSGAIYFSLTQNKSVLSDTNTELINAYIALQKNWSKVKSYMLQWKVDKKTYYKVRQYEPKNSYEKAARFIWLNRTCYGGLYRENKNGIFNVPYGGGSRTPECLYNKCLLEKAGLNLRKNVRLINSDFETIIDQTNDGDLIYCDPTYSSVKTNTFDRYGSKIFSWNDQVRLSKAAIRAFNRGVVVIVSNGYFNDLIRVYPCAYRIVLYSRKGICRNNKNVINGYEYLLILDPRKRRKYWERIGYIENKRIKIQKNGLSEQRLISAA